MAEILHIYQCLVCHFEIAVRIFQSHTCPVCKAKMSYITSRPK